MRQPSFGIFFLAAACSRSCRPPPGGQPSGNTNSSDNTPWNRRLEQCAGGRDQAQDRPLRYGDRGRGHHPGLRLPQRHPQHQPAKRESDRLHPGHSADRRAVREHAAGGRLDGSNQIGLAFLDGNVLYIDTRSATEAAKPTPPPTGLADRLGEGPDRRRERQFRRRRGGFAGKCQRRQSRLPICDPDRRLHRRRPGGYRCGPNAMAALPVLGPFFERPEGTAHFLNGQLIALVRPASSRIDR